MGNHKFRDIANPQFLGTMARSQSLPKFLPLFSQVNICQGLTKCGDLILKSTIESGLILDIGIKVITDEESIDDRL